MNRFYVVLGLLLFVLSAFYDGHTYMVKQPIDYVLGCLLFLFGLGYLLFKGKIYS